MKTKLNSIDQQWLKLRLIAKDMSEDDYLQSLIEKDLLNPVLVWQMGKVGSKSILNLLEAAHEFAVFHFHHSNPEIIDIVKNRHDKTGNDYPANLKFSMEFLETMEAIKASSNQPIKIVSAVRDPLERNISAFFQNLALYAPPQPPADVKKYADLLIEQFIQEYDQTLPLLWFNREINSATDLNVFEGQMDPETSQFRLTSEKFDLLVLRVEDSDELKAKLLNDFLNRENLVFRRDNKSSVKSYANLYKNFLERIVIPKHMIDLLYDSQLCRTFYSPEEIMKMKEKWKISDT